MKKLLVAIMFGIPSICAAELGDVIKATLLDHVTASAIYGFRSQDGGQARVALTDGIINIGNYKGYKFINIQAGFFGNPDDVDGEPTLASWIVGSQFRVDPFLKSFVPLDPDWEFLNSIQHGPSSFYDLTNNKWIVGYQVGLSFGLNPSQF